MPGNTGSGRPPRPRLRRALFVACSIGIVAIVVLGVLFATGNPLLKSLISSKSGTGTAPSLPPASSETPVANSSWYKVNASAWQDGGRPVLFFYGATWCPYCSASSWAVWKALSEFGGIVPKSAFSDYSSATDTDASTPEVVLAGAQSSSTIAIQVVEDTSGVEGNTTGTSNSYQQAYLSNYSGGGIPFVVINGQYIHAGALVDPSGLSSYANGADGGDIAVKNSILNETGIPWQVVAPAAWWVMAILAAATGESPAFLKATYAWSGTTLSLVQADYNLIT
jgi:uncharacterized protein DUF929